MNCGHSSCTGPVCTMSSGPKRPKVGIARVRAEIMEGLRNALDGRGRVIKETSAGLSVSIYGSRRAGEFIYAAESVLYQYPQWTYQIQVGSRSISGWIARIRIQAPKD